jgi:hypothetical protein
LKKGASGGFEKAVTGKNFWQLLYIKIRRNFPIRSGSRPEPGLERFKVQSSRFKVQGSRFKVQGSRFKVEGRVMGVKAWWGADAPQWFIQRASESHGA